MYLKQEQCTPENGEEDLGMDLENRFGLMVLNISVCLDYDD
jgi:hypothetical protein